jgi:GDP-L-fucose synthase
MGTRHAGRIHERDGFRPTNLRVVTDLPIGDLARLIGEIVHPDAEILFDTSEADGTHRKLLETSRMESSGWTAAIPLSTGIQVNYTCVLADHANAARQLLTAI